MVPGADLFVDISFFKHLLLGPHGFHAVRQAQQAADVQ